MRNAATRPMYRDGASVPEPTSSAVSTIAEPTSSAAKPRSVPFAPFGNAKHLP